MRFSTWELRRFAKIRSEYKQHSDDRKRKVAIKRLQDDVASYCGRTWVNDIAAPAGGNKNIKVFTLYLKGNMDYYTSATDRRLDLMKARGQMIAIRSEQRAGRSTPGFFSSFHHQSQIISGCRMVITWLRCVRELEQNKRPRTGRGPRGLVANPGCRVLFI